MDADTRAVKALWDWRPPDKLQALAERDEWRGLVFHIAAAIRAAEAEAVAAERAAIVAELEAERKTQDATVKTAQDQERWSVVNHGVSRLDTLEWAILLIQARGQQEPKP